MNDNPPELAPSTQAHQPTETLEFRVAERTADLDRAIQTLSAERLRFNEVLDALPLYVILLTPDYHVPFANRFFEERFGKSGGARCYEYLFHRSEPCSNCETYKVLRTNSSHRWKWTGPDGRKYDIHDFPFTDVDGKPLIMEVGFDVTEQIRNEFALREKTNEVQRLADQLRALAVDLSQAELKERKRLSRILHDHIQQLLVAARMQVGWLKSVGSLDSVYAAAREVDGILGEALESSRSLTIELSPPILHEAGLTGGLNWLASQMFEKNHFRVNLRSDNHAEPATEEMRFLLFECARELLFNAVKHADVSEAHVTLLRTRDGHIRLIVRDEGKGFDPDLLKKRSAGEASFGLFSIQQRLTHLCGDMRIATAPGKGTSIILTLPVAGPQEGRGAAARTAAEEGRANGAPVGDKTAIYRVLIVDDHKIVREGLAGLMQFESDIEVVGQAADGLQAIELSERFQPDVVVMDVNLGEMNGVEVTRKILAGNPGIRVIGLSMHVDPAIARGMRDAGAAAYLNKGAPSEDLLATIRACARSSRSKTPG